MSENVSGRVQSERCCSFDRAVISDVYMDKGMKIKL